MGWEAVERARLRLSREQGTIVKDWGGRLPVALVYPNTYFVGMSNLGLHAIYRLLNSFPDVVCERAFLEKEDAAGGQPPLSLESQRPLTDFAVIAFSVSYELDYFNVVRMLRTSGIPLRAADRDEQHPLIIAGGPCLTANPLPLAPFVDAVGVGEAEAIMPAILPVLHEGLQGARQRLLARLALVPGLYVPAATPDRVTRQCAASLDDFPVASAVLTLDTELGDMYLIEVERGCAWECRFCLASAAFRPIRFRSIDSLLAQAGDGLKYRKRLGLVGAAVTSHPRIEELTARLREVGAEISVSSLRIKPLSPVVLGEVARGGGRSATLAPEAGSQRLRDVIRKGISEEDILAAMDRVAEAGIRQVKLYFMVGLPSETDDDIQAMIDLVLKCKTRLEGRVRGFGIGLNVSPFVPKAGTAFQWLPMAPVATLERRLAMLKSALRPHGIKLSGESPAWSEVQAVLARGDARVAGVLGEMDRLSLPAWRKAVAACHLDIDYYAHRKWDVNAALPWAVLEQDRDRLKTELARACRAARLS